MHDQRTLINLPEQNPKHPAKFTNVLIPVFARMLQGSLDILDPFAGTGKIFLLERWIPDARIRAVEIEPAWASIHPKTIVGNALRLPFRSGVFDAICTSPTYGNRMADTLIDSYERITYTAKLGKQLHPDNSGAMQWGETYRDFHRRAWKEVLRTLKPHGKFILNIKDHIRAGKVQEVTAWHIHTLTDLGLYVVERQDVQTPSMKHGQNSEARVAFESVILFSR